MNDLINFKKSKESFKIDKKKSLLNEPKEIQGLVNCLNREWVTEYVSTCYIELSNKIYRITIPRYGGKLVLYKNGERLLEKTIEANDSGRFPSDEELISQTKEWADRLIKEKEEFVLTLNSLKEESNSEYNRKWLMTGITVDYIYLKSEDYELIISRYKGGAAVLYKNKKSIAKKPIKIGTTDEMISQTKEWANRIIKLESQTPNVKEWNSIRANNGHRMYYKDDYLIYIPMFKLDRTDNQITLYGVKGKVLGRKPHTIEPGPQTAYEFDQDLFKWADDIIKEDKDIFKWAKAVIRVETNDS